MSNDRFLHVDAGRVQFDIARLLEAYPELGDDDELRADMVEGSTEIAPVLTRLYRSLKADEAQADGAKAFKADLDARQKRFENRAARKRSMVMAVMEAADLQKLDLPIATFSVQDGRVRAVVDDASDLPQGFFETVRKPKSSEIKAALLAGQDVPGARLEIGDDFLTIRGA